jgi:two-component system chemotaxis response regulator CheB
LPLFPHDLSVPILIVQHMPPGFTAPFAQRLNTLCSVIVREATQGEAILPGVAYIAPSGLHMSVDRVSDSRTILCLDPHPEDCLHIPSVDVLMNSVAEAFKNLALGVIMTGMGSDGAAGMQSIHRQGGLTIGQDEASCTVYGMPRACAELGILTRVVPLSQIPAQILHATHYRRRA